MNWLFDFNKGHKEERGLVSDLAKKIKKSEQISFKSENNTEKYVFDNIELGFVLAPARKLQLFEDGKVVYEMDCEWNQYDEWSQQRFYFFGGLLERARGRYEDYQKQIAKKTKINSANAKLKAEQEKKKSETDKNLLYIKNARNKLK